jgi:hypothetical protein
LWLANSLARSIKMITKLNAYKKFMRGESVEGVAGRIAKYKSWVFVISFGSL